LLLMALMHLVAWIAATASSPPYDLFSAGAAPSASANGSDAVAARYAPIVYLHPDEQFGPGDPLSFLAHSRLMWAHDESCRDHIVAETVDAGALGAGKYFHRHSQRRLLNCRHRGPILTSLASVRPRTRESGEEGFFLDLRSGRERAGIGAAAPVLYYYVPQRYIAYWFFYPYNDGGIVDHDGDWENIVVQLDAQERPTEVAYYAHGHATIYPWEEIEHEGERPVVYSARGSHASYPSRGPHLGIPTLDWTAAGERWDTAARLRNVVRESWWGYGGAWGQVGEIASTTGPKGPSPFKLGVPLNWIPPNILQSSM